MKGPGKENGRKDCWVGVMDAETPCVELNDALDEDWNPRMVFGPYERRSQARERRQEIESQHGIDQMIKTACLFGGMDRKNIFFREQTDLTAFSAQIAEIHAMGAQLLPRHPVGAFRQLQKNKK